MDVAPRLDMSSIVGALRQGRWILLECVVAACLIAAIYVNLTVPKYTATAILVPAETASGVQRSGGGSALLGLVSMAGLQSSQAENFDQFLQLMLTPSVAQKMDQNYGTVKKIFASQWDATENKWRPPSGAISYLKSIVDGLLGRQSWAKPGQNALNRYVIANVDIEKVRNLDAVTISYQNKDPRYAVAFLNELYKTTDTLVRDEMRSREAANISYLRRELANVQVSEQREALIQILSDEEKSLMLASSGVPFAARFLQPPIASDQPTSPAPIRSLAVAMLLGLFVGASISIVAFLAGAPQRGQPVLETVRRHRSVIRWLWNIKGARSRKEGTSDNFDPARGR